MTGVAPGRWTRPRLQTTQIISILKVPLLHVHGQVQMSPGEHHLAPIWSWGNHTTHQAAAVPQRFVGYAHVAGERPSAAVQDEMQSCLYDLISQTLRESWFTSLPSSHRLNFNITGPQFIFGMYMLYIFFHRYYFNTDESSICIPLPVVESRNPTLPLFLSHMKWDCGQPCLEEPSFPGTRRNSSNSTILTYICVAPTVRWAHFLSFWSLTIPRISGIPFLQVVRLRLKGGNNLHKFHSYEEAKSEYKTPQHLIVSITLNGSINKKDTNMY